MSQNEASRIIQVIDGRVRKQTASGARVETTWGTVAAVDADGRHADLYLYGNSGSYTSDYFRVPAGMAVNVGDSIKAAIDRERGDRWIEEVFPADEFNRVEFNVVDGEVRFGGGSVAADIRLQRSATKTLTIDDGAGGAVTVNIIGALQVDGVDVAAVPGDTVVDETSFGLSSGAGAADEFSRADHTHGTPSDPTTGDISPTRVRLTSISDVSLSSTLHALQIGADVDPNLAMDTNEIQARDNGAAAQLFLNNGGGLVLIGAGGLTVGGSVEAATDGGDDAFIVGDDATIFDGDTANFLGIKGQQDATLGGIVFGSAKDTNIYRSAADTLKTDDTFEAPEINMTGTTQNTSFAINNAGSATFSSKSCTWARLGPWVFFELAWTSSAAGSGTGTVTATGTGMPQVNGNGVVVGDSGGSGVSRHVARITNSGGSAAITEIRNLSGYTLVQGADLNSGQTFRFQGMYLTADAF
jgi:hypothetical protein